MSGFMKKGFGDKEMMCYNKNPIMDNYGNIRLLSKPRFLWIFKNFNPNTYKGLFLVWKEIYYKSIM